MHPVALVVNILSICIGIEIILHDLMSIEALVLSGIGSHRDEEAQGSLDWFVVDLSSRLSQGQEAGLK